MSIALLVGPLGSRPGYAGPSAPAASALGAACRSPSVPRWFHRYLVAAVKVSGDLRSGWARSPYIAKIVCWQGADFQAEFRAHDNSYHRWHGIFAMTSRELQTIAGPAETSNPKAFTVTTRCMVWGWERCPHKVANARPVQQLIVGLRWMWLNYGNSKATWDNIRRSGRFNSYPRPGTDDAATGNPFALCPVAGRVSYWDDFGQPRYVGGYHPHAGNDVMAPLGRRIRAPFDGLAVAHTGGTRGGNWVTVVGAKGYVQNDHLSRFGTLGFVKRGTVIGYVGKSGDALLTHDHFEWHPWVPAKPLHVAPSGFILVTDAIDPYPFLNQVCTR
jgi:hypothetical protein